MSRRRFETILGAMQFTNAEPSFWEVRQMLEAWNDNMKEQFVASWMSCLDEYMSKWVNEFTCPGYTLMTQCGAVSGRLFGGQEWRRALVQWCHHAPDFGSRETQVRRHERLVRNLCQERFKSCASQSMQLHYANP